LAHFDLILTAAPVAKIAEPHRRAVAAIVRAARQGLFTVAEAELLIDRVRTQATTFALSVADSLPSTGSGLTSSALPIRPDRTVG
jgi:hypothetical protein